MANKRLTTKQIAEMQAMVQHGVSPEDMAKYFNIAISSVHNYKKRFREQGVDFPLVRGKRPSGSIESVSREVFKDLDEMEDKANKLLNTREPFEPVVTNASSIDNSVSGEQVFKVYVNNKLIQIIGDIENIMIKKNSIEITV